ncbi:MAG: hypothetical protein Q9225_006955 [Loekoesia sp. 1 TL-2023]
MPSPTSQALHSRIWSWAQEVDRSANPGRQPRLRPKCTGRVTSNGMKLRDRPARKTLVEISINPRCRKRKLAEAMPDSEKTSGGTSAQPAKKGRGRPLGSKNKASAAVEDNGDYQRDDEPVSLPSRGHPASIPDLPPPSASSAKTPQSRQSSSPSKSKRGERMLGQPRPDATIDMAFLETCKPSVTKRTFRELKAAGKLIPEAAQELRQKLLFVPKGLIPFQLKARYDKDLDTPRKSKDPIHEQEYLDPASTPFTNQQLERLMHTVEEVHRKASTAANIKAHERQWGSIMTQILHEAEGWPEERDAVLLNVPRETCSIQPVEFKPSRPETKGPLDGHARTAAAESAKSDAPDNLGRMVDWVLALQLSMHDLGLISRAFSRCMDSEHSLNQSLSYITRYPIFADVEVKTSSNRDPEVQLAIWAVGAVLKRRHHGWNTEMPMPAIVVDGHMWKWYLLFVVGDDVQMTGPEFFGDTSTTQGIWTIFYRLHILVEWGTTVFARWVQDEIIGWAKGLTEASDDV